MKTNSFVICFCMQMMNCRYYYYWNVKNEILIITNIYHILYWTKHIYHHFVFVNRCELWKIDEFEIKWSKCILG